MENIIAASISAAVTLIVCLITNSTQQAKTRALIQYQIEDLTKRMDKHNRVIERTYALESRAAVVDEEIKVANHRISDLEKKVG